MDSSLIPYGIYASVFLSTLLLAHGIWQVLRARREREAALRRRLRDWTASPAIRPVPGGLRRDRQDFARETAVRAALLRWLAETLDRAGLTYSVHAVLAGAAGLTTVLIVATAALAVLTGFPAMQSWALHALALAVGFAGGIGLPIVYLRQRGARRLRRFASQLPDALDVMVRSLRAGHPVGSAMSMVETDLPEPIAGEFGKAVDEMTYGLDLRQALSHLAARVDVQDLRFVIASVRLQHETGGNLAEVLEGLADLIRARARLTRKVRAFAAEARLSARILAVMPLIFVGLILWANPEIYRDAARDPLFFPVLLAAGGLQVIGILVMGRMAGIRA